MPYVGLKWLADHVEIAPNTDIAKLAEDLVQVGLEEERIVPAAVSGPLVVGKVLTCDPEPQSNGKTINYCRVDVGKYNDAPGEGKEPSTLPSRSIVCGAHNFGVGDLVVVVLPGAVLPGPFPISSRKTYGHISDGMICSARELGLGEDHGGIIVLTEMFPELAAKGQLPAPGESVIELLELGEELLEINITPDRGYCFSMRGVAREYSHSTGMKFTDPGLPENLPSGCVPTANGEGFKVEINDTAPVRGKIGCDRFVTRVVSGVNPQAKSPKWLVQRLEQAGMRSISLAVDITNYVMMDLGQPLHAYDLGKVAEPLVVRRGRAGEKLLTLDEIEREIDVEDLVISDSPDTETGGRVLALAGVMGGLSSEVTENTTDILVEAAHFESVSIARTVRRHRLPSEASKRFERGVDPLLPEVAAQRVVDLLVEYGGGKDTGRVFDYNQLPTTESIVMDWQEPARLTGLDYDKDTIVEVLQRIGCKVQPGDTGVEVIPPTWRNDIMGPAHLVEEIARLCGYDAIPSRIPRPIAGHGLTNSQQARRDVARALAEQGLVQVLSYPFVSEENFDKQLLGEQDIRRQAVRLANPLAEDAPLMRTSILDSLLPIATRNVSRGNTDCGIYEIGLVTRPLGTSLANTVGVEDKPSDEDAKSLREGVPNQPRHVAGVFVGAAELAGIHGNARLYDWADAVQSVRHIADTLGTKMSVRAEDVRGGKPNFWQMTGPAGDDSAVAPFHPGRCARIIVRGQCVGLAGQLHPQVVDNFGLPAGACAFEIDLDRFIQAMSKRDFQVKAVSTFPPAKEDLALVVDKSVKADDLAALIRKQVGELLEEVRLFDIYEGDQIEETKKSLAFSIRMRSAEGTLTAEQTANIRNSILKAAAKKFKAELRG